MNTTNKRDIAPTPTASAEQLRAIPDAREISPRVRSISTDGTPLYDLRKLSHTQVRRATPEDHPFIAALQRQFSNELGWLPDKAIAEKIDASEIGIYRTGPRRLGYIYARPALAWQPLLRSIVQIAVVPDCQHKHIGLTMVASVIHRALVSGQLGVQAICRADLPIQRFWLNLDFRPICLLRASGSRNHPKIVYRLPLAKKLPLWFVDPPKRCGWRSQLLENQRNEKTLRHPEARDFPPPLETDDLKDETRDETPTHQTPSDARRNASGRVDRG